ncbi:AAA family ATPase [Paracoccus mutanolyticus]|uniref:AAA family ATPase n=1 Tax=Paracoccus mutanolyticus TaxID=1499308 RepID=UPI001CB890A5|nr:AAA family ATPase [Paracoccus mutanolyticus]
MLVGANNCGKTTVIEALALLFGRDRMIRQLTEHELHSSNPQPADRIRLIATVIGFHDDDPAQHATFQKLHGDDEDVATGTFLRA